MKIFNIVVVMFVAVLLSGCATFDQKAGNFIVGALYGRSGVFVTNNYADTIIRVSTNNGINVEIRTGQTAQLLTSGMINGDQMLVMAKFYSTTGEYLGYDSSGFYVYYRNGSPFVVNWDPYLRPTYQIRR